MKIIAVVGTKNTGKTVLVSNIVQELVKRGYNVGTVKHVAHSFDVEGRDTWKHKEAGAELVVASGDETFFLVNETLKLEKILEFTEYLKKLDFMVLEGFKQSKYAKISTSDFEDEFTLKKVNPFQMDNEAIQSLVDLIEERSFSMFSQMNCGECGFKGCDHLAQAVVRGDADEMACVMKKEKKVQLTIDGINVPLNPFVQKFVQNVTIGMLNSLKKSQVAEDEGKKIELLIRNEDN